MRFNNDKYSITFQYEKVQPSTQQLIHAGIDVRMTNKHVVRQTTCIIRKVAPGAKTEDGQILATAVATQSLLDPDNKFLARKFAMTRAMKACFNKQERTKIWEEYLAKVAIPS